MSIFIQILFFTFFTIFLSQLTNSDESKTTTIQDLEIEMRTRRIAPVYNIGKIGGKYYLTDSDWYGQMTFIEALDFCQYNGFRLGMIRNEDENQLLVDFLIEAEEIKCFWLPATDFSTEGKFYWLTRGHVELNYTNFIKMPNISRLNNCVLMRSNGQWFQTPCSTKYIKTDDPDSFGCMPLCEI